MKNKISKFIALLAFASVLAASVSSCSVEYRQRHHHEGHDEHYHN